MDLSTGLPAADDQPGPIFACDIAVVVLADDGAFVFGETPGRRVLPQQSNEKEFQRHLIPQHQTAFGHVIC